MNLNTNTIHFRLCATMRGPDAEALYDRVSLTVARDIDLAVIDGVQAARMSAYDRFVALINKSANELNVNFEVL